MKKKHPYLILIGLDANRPCNVSWSKYQPEVWHVASIDQRTINYRDSKSIYQVREETWDVTDCYCWLLLNVHGVKDNDREGEQVVLIWD
jgi:hypothetical protein